MLPFINAPFGVLANATGASIDELKLIASFLLSYPLAAALKRLPDNKPWQKNAFICAVSMFYLVGLFDLWDGVRTLLYSAAGAYAIAYYIDGSLMPWIGFAFLMGHMSINHIERQARNAPADVDITGAQMVLVMKLSAFCWNVHDGRLPASELSEFQRNRAIRELPGLLDYAAYVLFFPSLFAGPAFDYNDYRRWLTTVMFDPEAEKGGKVPPTRKQRRIPRSGTPAAKKAVIGLVWIFAFLQFSGWYNVETVTGAEFLTYGIFRRIWNLHMFGFTTRLKYYGVWSLTEGACILTGMGYNGFDPKTQQFKWDRLENVYPLGIETAQNTRAYLDSWNKNTNHWLRNYVYLRVTPKGKKPGFRASLATFSTSAFWHGFYPGYYMSFILAAFLQTVAKNFRRYVRPFFFEKSSFASPTAVQVPTPYKRYYDFLSWLTTQLAFSFTVAPFVLLNFAPCVQVWARVYFYTILGTAAAMGFFASPAKAYLIQQLKSQGKIMPSAKKTDAATPAPQTQPGTAPTRQLTPQEKALVDELAADGIDSAGWGTSSGGMMGVSEDIKGDFDEAIREISDEIDARKRRGSKVVMPNVGELRAMVEGKIGRKLPG